MASEIAQRNRELAQDLADIQKNYRQRRKDLIENQEQDLQQLRDKYDNDRSKIVETNEAAINHIRKSGKESIEAAQEFYNQRLANEQQQGQERIGQLKRYTEANVRALDSRVKDKEITVSENIKQWEQKEAEIRNRQQSTTTQYLEKQNELLSKAQQEGQGKIEDIYKRQNEKQKKLVDSSNSNLQKLNESYQKTYQKESQARAEAIERYKTEAQKNLENIRNKNDERLTNERQRGDQSLNKIKNTFEIEAQQTQAKGEQKLDNYKKQNQSQLEAENIRYNSQAEKLREQYHSNIDTLHTKGETQITEQKQQLEHKMQAQDEYYNRETNRRKEQFESRSQLQAKNYQEALAKNKDIQEKNIQQQRIEHQKNIDNLKRTYKQEAQVQSDIFNKDLINKKIEHIKDVTKYTETEDDPFYKLENHGSRLIETPTNYILKTYVPPHEKDNIKVRIHNDKAVVSGARSYKDQLETDTKKLATNNFQTFKEEFVFTKPVANNIARQEKDGDYLIFTIPKLAYATKD